MTENYLSIILSLIAVLCLAGVFAFCKKALSKQSMLKQRWDFVINGSTQGLWDWDIQTNTTFSSAQWKQMLGYDDNDIGDSVPEWHALIHPEDQPIIDDAVKMHLTGLAPHYEAEYRVRCKNGDYLWVRDYGEVFKRDKQGKPLRMLGTQTDISKRKAAELLSAEQLELTQQIIKYQSVATFMIDAQHRVTHWNKAAVELTGAKEEDMVGSDEAWRAFYDSPRPCLADLVLDDESESAGNYYPKQGPSTLLKKTSWHAEAWFDNLGGKRRYVIFDATPIFDKNGEVATVIETLQDVTESKLIKQALDKEQAVSEQAKKSLEDQQYALDQHSIVATTDVKGNITYVNEKFCEISGYSNAELLGQKHSILNSGYHSENFFKEMYRTIAGGHVWHGEICNKNKEGSIYWVDTTIVPFMDKDGKPHEYIAIRTDITDQKRAEEEAKNLAYYDPLTGLPNRRLLFDRLSQALAFSKRSKAYGAIMFIDLDRFKALNDTMGHDAGDLLLQKIAKRLSSDFREIDTVARLGGDEFVVVLNSLSNDSTEAKTQAEIVKQKLINTLSQPYDLNGHLHQSTASIGIALLHSGEGDVEEMLKKADRAMYEDKVASKNSR